jgi:outer membrane protein
MLAALLIIPTIVLTSTQHAHTPKRDALTLESAIHKGLNHRPDLKSRTYAIHAARYNAHSERSGYLPTVNISSNLLQQKGESAPGNTTLVTANQLIYSGAGPLERFKKADLDRQATEDEKKAYENKIRYEIEQAFFNAYLAQQQQTVIAKLNKSNHALFAQAKLQKKSALLLEQDWLTKVDDYAQTDLQIQNYKSNTSQIFARLGFLMGEENKKLQHHILHWHNNLPKALNPLSSYQELAVRSRPERAQADKKIAIEKQNIRLAQGVLLPTVSMQAQAGYQHTLIPGEGTHSRPSKGLNTGYHAVGITATWNIFDGLINQYQSHAAQARKIKESLEQEQIILQIKQDVTDAFYNLRKTRTSLKAARLTYIKDRNLFKLRREEYAQRLIEGPAFKKALSDWAQAHLNFLSKKIDVARSWHTLLYACGYADEITTP